MCPQAQLSKGFPLVALLASLWFYLLFCSRIPCAHFYFLSLLMPLTVTELHPGLETFVYLKIHHFLLLSEQLQPDDQEIDLNVSGHSMNSQIHSCSTMLTSK